MPQTRIDHWLAEAGHLTQDGPSAEALSRLHARIAEQPSPRTLRTARQRRRRLLEAGTGAMVALGLVGGGWLARGSVPPEHTRSGAPALLTAVTGQPLAPAGAALPRPSSPIPLLAGADSLTTRCNPDRRYLPAADHADRAPADVRNLLRETGTLDPDERLAVRAREASFLRQRLMLEDRRRTASGQLADAIGRDARWSPQVDKVARQLEHTAGELRGATLAYVLDVRAGLKPAHRVAYDRALAVALRRGSL